MATAQDVCFIILAVLTLISFLTVQIFSYTTMSGHSGDVNGTSYDTDLVPPGWAFSIWGVIYIWQFSWMIYVLTTLCRQVNGRPIYQQLHVITKLYLIIYIINMALNVAFFYVYINTESGTIIPIVSVGSIWLTVLLCLVIYHRNMAAVPEKTAKMLRKDLICLVVLVQNGLAIYVSWCTLANMLCLNSFFVYFLNIPMSTSSPVVLTILSVLLILYFILEMTYLKDYLEYTFSFYPAIMWGLASRTIDKFDPQCPTSIYVVVLLCVVTLFFLVKIPVTVIRSKKSDPPQKYAAFN